MNLGMRKKEDKEGGKTVKLRNVRKMGTGVLTGLMMSVRTRRNECQGRDLDYWKKKGKS